jgi:hypothetical protein
LAPPAVHRRGYRASGLVLTSIRDIESVATTFRLGSKPAAANL